MSTRDSQRKKVYQAEDFAAVLFARAAERNTYTIEFFGSTITLPPTARFSGVESAQRYVDAVLGMAAVKARWPQARPVRVRARRGTTAAHYSNGVIAIPEHRADNPFLTELVLAHELAHHLAPPGSAHGPEFLSTYLELVGAVMGPEAEHVLRVLMAHHGAR